MMVEAHMLSALNDLRAPVTHFRIGSGLDEGKSCGRESVVLIRVCATISKQKRRLASFTRFSHGSD